MADQPKLMVESRTQHGSAVAGRLRRQGRIPGVLYGRGESQPVSIDATEFRQQVPVGGYGSMIVTLFLDGVEAGVALVKAVQVNTLEHSVMNVDLQRVNQQDRVSISVSVLLEGEPAAVRLGGVLEQLMHSVNLRCRVSNVPAVLTYDVSEMQIGETIHARDLLLSPECELLDKPDDAIAVIVAPTVPVEEEPVEVAPEVSGPELEGGKQKDDFPPER